LVGPGPGGHLITIACAARKDVIARAAAQAVGPIATFKPVGALAPDQRVIARPAIEIIAIAAQGIAVRPARVENIIALRDPARPPLLAVADLERLFGLSPAEARLATRLVDGATPDEAAIGLGISRNTARSQLQAIFMKTGVNRQGDLIRLLLSSAASQTVEDAPLNIG
jgi:DNA-binding CsgD family transcriptional regulator